jgi:hypothetical protein
VDEKGNGLTARVHTLEAQAVNIKDDIVELKQSNSEEHKEIRAVVGKIQGIGWVIVGGMAVGVFLMLLERVP